MSQQPYGPPPGRPDGQAAGAGATTQDYGTASSGYVPTPQWSGTGHPQGGGIAPDTPGDRPRQSGGAATWVLGALAVALLVGVGVLGAVANSSLSKQHRDIAGLKSQSTADASADAASSSAAPQVDTAALQEKYTAVKTADGAIAAAVQKWNAGDSSTKFGSVIDALQRCYRAVDEYDRAAAPVPDAQRGSLPPRSTSATPRPIAAGRRCAGCEDAMSNEFPPAGNPDPAPGRPPPTSSEPVDLDPLTQLAGARPQEPQHQQPQPPYQQPGYQQPEYQQPQYPQPQYPQPQYPQPQYQQPQYQQPQYQQPQYQQPQYQQPQYPQPGYVPAAQPVPPPGYGAGWDGTYRPPGAPQFTPSPSSTTVSGDRRRSALVPVLAAAVVLLVVALAGTAVWWTNTSGKNADQISALKSAHAAREKRVADAAAARSALVTKAALPGKLADVRVRTKKVRDEDVAWTKRSEAAQFSTLHTYAELQASCLEAVVLYDAAAATLTDAERGTDPAQVDMLDDSYNCQADRWNS